MTKAVAIVPAAGSGLRLGMKTGKPFVMLKGRPIIAHTLKALAASPRISAIIVAADAGSIGRMFGIVKKYRVRKVKRVIAGGATRQESVSNCLAAAGDDFDIAVVHDGARPLVDAGIINEAVEAAEKYGACVTVVPETDTVKSSRGGKYAEKTIPRSVLYRAQTPQAFRMDVIRKAYSLKGKSPATDDSAFVEGMGVKVRLVKGSYRNIKITTREDLKLAEVLL